MSNQKYFRFYTDLFPKSNWLICGFDDFMCGFFIHAEQRSDWSTSDWLSCNFNAWHNFPAKYTKQTCLLELFVFICEFFWGKNLRVNHLSVFFLLSITNLWWTYGCSEKLWLYSKFPDDTIFASWRSLRARVSVCITFDAHVYWLKTRLRESCKLFIIDFVGYVHYIEF